MAGRRFTAGERRRLAGAGNALPDGSYPIPDCDALRRAVDSYGRETGDRAALRRLIVKRKAELGCPEVELPETWHLTRR